MIRGGVSGFPIRRKERGGDRNQIRENFTHLSKETKDSHLGGSNCHSGGRKTKFQEKSGSSGVDRDHRLSLKGDTAHSRLLTKGPCRRLPRRKKTLVGKASRGGKGKTIHAQRDEKGQEKRRGRQPIANHEYESTGGNSLQKDLYGDEERGEDVNDPAR